MRHLDLFSGIGGFALAASWVWGTDHEIVSFCEIDPFCHKVLKKHWPAVPIHNDIKTMKGKEFGTIDLISGRFPCQPYSVAGKRKGKNDDRALWPEMFRVIKEAKPRWIIGENVAGFVNMGLDDCLFDLASEGYETTAFIIPACAVNAPHRRDRVWIVANRYVDRTGERYNGNAFTENIGEIQIRGDCQSSENQSANIDNSLDHASNAQSRETQPTEPGRLYAGSCGTVEDDRTSIKNAIILRNKRRGNGNQAGGECSLQTERSDKSYSNVADSDRFNGDNGRFDSGEVSQFKTPKICGQPNATHTGSERLQGGQRPGTHDERPVSYGSASECHSAWGEPWIEAATRFCRVDDGVSDRTHRLKSLGNAIVPQVVYEIMKAIKEIDNQCRK